MLKKNIVFFFSSRDCQNYVCFAFVFWDFHFLFFISCSFPLVFHSYVPFTCVLSVTFFNYLVCSFVCLVYALSFNLAFVLYCLMLILECCYSVSLNLPVMDFFGLNIIGIEFFFVVCFSSATQQ